MRTATLCAHWSGRLTSAITHSWISCRRSVANNSLITVSGGQYHKSWIVDLSSRSINWPWSERVDWIVFSYLSWLDQRVISSSRSSNWKASTSFETQLFEYQILNLQYSELAVINLSKSLKLSELFTEVHSDSNWSEETNSLRKYDEKYTSIVLPERKTLFRIPTNIQMFPK